MQKESYNKDSLESFLSQYLCIFSYNKEKKKETKKKVLQRWQL